MCCQKQSCTNIVLSAVSTRGKTHRVLEVSLVVAAGAVHVAVVLSCMLLVDHWHVKARLADVCPCEADIGATLTATRLHCRSGGAGKRGQLLAVMSILEERQALLYIPDILVQTANLKSLLKAALGTSEI